MFGRRKYITVHVSSKSRLSHASVAGMVWKMHFPFHIPFPVSNGIAQKPMSVITSKP